MKKKLTILLVIVMALSMIAALAGCGSSDDSSTIPNGANIYVDAGAEDRYSALETGGFFLANAVASPPIDANTTVVLMLHSPDNGAMLTFAGNTTGTYTVTAGTATIAYTDASANTYAAGITLPITSGSIEVTEYAEVGGDIVGTYSFIASIYVDGSPTENTTSLTGSFSVERQADDSY